MQGDWQEQQQQQRWAGTQQLPPLWQLQVELVTGKQTKSISSGVGINWQQSGSATVCCSYDKELLACV
jgi:hypothetical protein